MRVQFAKIQKEYSIEYEDGYTKHSIKRVAIL
jgi:hypothetical protein